jgi:uncharacterized membrane protein
MVKLAQSLSSSKSAQSDQRYEFLDFVRGIAIILMLFFHSFTYFEGDLNSFADAAADNPIATGIKFFGRFTGAFALISGVSNSIMFKRRVSAGYSPKKILIGIIIYGSCIFLFDLVAKIFFNRAQTGGGPFNFEEGPTYYSIVTGLLETNYLIYPSVMTVLFTAGPLTMIAQATITTGIVMYLLLRKNSERNVYQMIMILGVIGTTLILMSPLIVGWLRPIWIDAILNGQSLKAFLLTFIVGDKHPFFPFSGFALYGAMFGLSLAAGVPRKKVCLIGALAAFFYILAGSVAYMVWGEPPVGYVFRSPAFQTILLQMGFMLTIFLCFYYMQLNRDTSISKKIVQNAIVRRFGVCTLTIYIFESVLGTGLKTLVIDRIFPGWATQMGWIVIYSIFLIFLWSQILKLWEYNGFKGSFEWFLFLMTARFRPGAGSRFKAIKPINSAQISEK